MKDDLSIFENIAALAWSQGERAVLRDACYNTAAALTRFAHALQEEDIAYMEQCRDEALASIALIVLNTVGEE